MPARRNILFVNSLNVWCHTFVWYNSIVISMPHSFIFCQFVWPIYFVHRKNAETCSLTFRILASLWPLKAISFSSWWTTGHGWETEVHVRHTCGNLWLPRLLLESWCYSTDILFIFFGFNGKNVVAFSSIYSQDYLLLQIPKWGRKGGARRLPPNPMLLNRRNLRGGSSWLMRQCCLKRGFCCLWRNCAILHC